MISTARLQTYLDDYATVTGTRTDKFICPITLRACDSSELIEGHILNSGFLQASSRTVVQYGAIDHFYGTRVEESFVAYLNMKDLGPLGFLKAAQETVVEFEDGTTADAFPATGVSARHAEGKFPQSSGTIDGVEHVFFVKTSHDDRRLQQKMRLTIKSRPFPPAHWTASMLKAGYLAMFDMLGYRTIYEPFGDTIRRTLASFYNENASRDDAALFFAEFRYATKFAGTGSSPNDLRANYKPFPFDTLERRQLLLHFTPLRNLFASTCVFQINGVTATVTLPAMVTGGDVVNSWRFYERLVRDERPPQKVHPAEYADGQWRVQDKPIDAHMLTDEEVREMLATEQARPHAE